MAGHRPRRDLFRTPESARASAFCFTGNPLTVTLRNDSSRRVSGNAGVVRTAGLALSGRGRESAARGGLRGNSESAERDGGMRLPATDIESEDVAQHYDRLDPFYRKCWGEHLHHGLWRSGRETPREAVEHLIEFSVEPLGIRAGDRVCDVGCGYGATAKYLQRFHGVRATGVTNSPVQFEAARSGQKDCSALEFRLENWEETKLPVASFDAVLSIECLAHVADKAAFFHQVHRVLKPGGRAVILDWTASSAPHDWQARFLLEPICRHGSLADLGKLVRYREAITAAGLQWVSCDDLTSQVRQTWSVLTRRIFTKALPDPEAWRFLGTRPVTAARLALSIPRLMMAYRWGALRYVRLVLEKRAA